MCLIQLANANTPIALPSPGRYNHEVDVAQCMCYIFHRFLTYSNSIFEKCRHGENGNLNRVDISNRDEKSHSSQYTRYLTKLMVSVRTIGSYKQWYVLFFPIYV